MESKQKRPSTSMTISQHNTYTHLPQQHIKDSSTSSSRIIKSKNNRKVAPIIKSSTKTNTLIENISKKSSATKFSPTKSFEYPTPKRTKRKECSIPVWDISYEEVGLKSKSEQNQLPTPPESHDLARPCLILDLPTPEERERQRQEALEKYSWKNFECDF
ncbi:hypothetical protein G9A89_014245 [Geosiphon pyriformis]|nr:hypothetical protein G9A89_014245 [Geosiphon pyriformis]